MRGKADQEGAASAHGKSRDRARRARLTTALVLAALLALLCPRPCPATTPEYLADEQPAGSSADQLPSPFPDSFGEPPPMRRALEALREAAKDLPDFIRQSKASARFRTFYLDQDIDGGGRRQAWAGGGWLSLKTGWAAGRVQVGGTFYTAQPIYAPHDRAGTLLLAPGQEAISALGQAYLRFRLVEGTNLTIYRQEVDLPFINRRDSRMVPNTFEGVMLASRTWDKVKFVAGHLRAIKTRESNSFQSMSEAAGAGGDGGGVTLGGLLLEPVDKLTWGVISEQAWDFMHTLYTEANWAWKGPQGGASWKLSAQYARQDSVGDELGGGFSTGFAGARASAGWGGAVAYLAYTQVDSGGEVRNPWGGYPGYTSLQIKNFQRPGEATWLVGMSYDFARLGLDGVSAFANYAVGHTPDSGTNASPDQSELDVTLDWRPAGLGLKGLWLRARGARVDQDGGQSMTECQFILNYDLDLL